MCSFIVTNRDIQDLEKVNFYSQKRGPDFTHHCLRDGVHFVHNLLHLTGNKTSSHQPFEDGDIVATFNGEIYNYKDFGDYETDGECIIPLYKEYGDEFTKHLDGEFAIVIVDFKGKKTKAYVDKFATKPLWYSSNYNGEFGYASYKSSLEALGFTNIYKHIPAWRPKFESVNPYTCWDLNQHKDTYDDWIEAFEKAVEKRTRSEYGIFLGLSAGYDSGSIALALCNQKMHHTAYTVRANENMDIVNERAGHALLEFGSMVDYYDIELTRKEYCSIKKELKVICEDFEYTDKFGTYNIKHDKASMGLGAICRRANQNNQRIYLSGQGADEILSDYGFKGRKFYSHSEFGGLFPPKLEGFFPWHSFYDGTQIKYLAKEEYVTGAYGIEGRYPFLDKQLVQEFLWLTPELKNKNYKAPIHEYLKRNDYPFDEGVKVGFGANRNLL